MNKVFLCGRLGRDVELKYTAGGTAIATLSMATGRKFKTKEGKEVDGVQWHRLKAFGKTAETAKAYLASGKEVAIVGRLETHEYEKNGEKRWSTEVVVEELKLIGGGKGKGDAPPKERDEAPPVGDDDIPF